MVTAVHGGRVWFGDREPLHVGFLPWWRVVDPPRGKASSGARSSEAGKDSIIGKIGRQGRSGGLREASEALA